MPKIIHYRNKCIGCGVCQQQQPELWRMSAKDGKAVLLHATKKKDIHMLDIHSSQQSITEAIATACPVRIIKLV
jgi:ferredoxin